ncbi:AglZ/HisF2 family acetamidino modification protein [Paracoccaceae bacterium]|nr:AglZ/HisF2 family acetamidino modification protein [Paracoccaceae bacterium]
MIRSRLIPCLLIHKGGLVKTRRFSEPRYVGDPINAVRIFNEKQVDELVVFDIDATVNNVEPDYRMIKYLASECRMPLCYGGGVNTVKKVEKIISLGVEKVAIGSAANKNPNLLSEASSRVGSQSVVMVIDVKKTGMFKKYEVVINNGKVRTGIHPSDLVNSVSNNHVGEIIINSVDRDGVLDGYDFELIDKIKPKVNSPLTVLGGAGSLDDIRELVKRYGLIGAAAGSLFVFKGKYRAVLINYPDNDTKEKIMR